MSELLKRLGPKAQRGSKPRCHGMTHGSREVVSARLIALVAPFAQVAPNERWMPDGFADIEEAQLHLATRLLPPEIRSQLGEWWLPADQQGDRTPNFDIASTCTIDGRAGLLLIEAKAHEQELMKEVVGRKVPPKDPEGRKASHTTIGAAIESARSGLATATGLPWQISRDSHYQMSNRFAWSWKLAELGVPVVLVYLGFLNANDMSKPGEVPLPSKGRWEDMVRAHSEPLFPDEVWNRSWSVNGVPFIPLVRSEEQALEPAGTP